MKSKYLKRLLHLSDIHQNPDFCSCCLKQFYSMFQCFNCSWYLAPELLFAIHLVPKSLCSNKAVQRLETRKCRNYLTKQRYIVQKWCLKVEHTIWEKHLSARNPKGPLVLLLLDIHRDSVLSASWVPRNWRNPDPVFELPYSMAVNQSRVWDAYFDSSGLTHMRCQFFFISS